MAARSSAAASAFFVRISIDDSFELIEPVLQPILHEITADFASVNTGETEEELDVGEVLVEPGRAVLDRVHLHRRQVLRRRHEKIPLTRGIFDDEIESTPVHVTLRVGHLVWNLRRKAFLREIRACFAAALDRFGMRLIEFSILGNHLHLIVEADSSEALSRGMQGLTIRIAKALNRLMDRNGNVFADHYHGRLLTTPAELVNAIAYVLENAARHYGTTGQDPFSSMALEARVVLAIPVSWLLRVGWRRAKRVPHWMLQRQSTTPTSS